MPAADVLFAIPMFLFCFPLREPLLTARPPFAALVE